MQKKKHDGGTVLNTTNFNYRKKLKNVVEYKCKKMNNLHTQEKARHKKIATLSLEMSNDFLFHQSLKQKKLNTLAKASDK
ncbi:hypothetical protein [uncultured Lactobacillus sp.]|uniref:hypothetical protein n=1 Tax=uncultured Lactobacillus sp. TaxID=153152 RepID=UPI00259BD77D|nr:hypothetical protein [uncultured Lactobacillus sp.]